MDVTISLPDKVFANLANLASKTHRRVDEVIVEKIERDFSPDVDFQEQAKIIKQSIKYCSDKEVLELANLQMPDDKRLSYLFEKNRESILTKKEHAELTKAVEISRINDLRKAFGIVEAKKRGLIK